MNKDCHRRKNYHRTPSTVTEKAGYRREDRYSQGKRQINYKAMQIGSEDIWWKYFKMDRVLGCLWSCHLKIKELPRHQQVQLLTRTTSRTCWWKTKSWRKTITKLLSICWTNGMERSTLWLMSIMPKYWIYQLQPTSLRLSDHYTTLLTNIYTVYAHLDKVAIKCRSCWCWNPNYQGKCSRVGEDEAWEWRVDCKSLQETPEKAHRSLRSLRHSDEVVS